MALNFPASPESGDQYLGSNGVTYTYDGVKWVGAGIETGSGFPIASETTAGVVRVDGTSITITNGVISSSGGTADTLTSIPNGTSAVIHTASSTYTSYKLVITVEGILDGDITSTRHTQTCEATIAAIYSSTVEPIISVYGVVYTSPAPLATFTVRRGLLNAIEVVALNSQTLETLHVSVHAVNIVSYYN